MTKKLPMISIVTLLIIGGSSQVLGQSRVNKRAEWFVDARFGMFIHWGVYSGAEGVWKGEKLRYDNDYAEWIYYRNRIEREEYLTLLGLFDWESISPEEWVLLAKAAGMKYVTLTAKHHDGFALWDSEVGNYDIGEYTDPRRDIVKELADACREHGLKLGLYYSHWVDWEHPYGWDHTKEIYPIEPDMYDRYWQEKVMPQMRELLTDYGDIGLIWFDMWIHHSKTIVSKEQLMQLKTLIRELQPDCLVNSRLGLSIEEDPDVDFRTLGDNQLGQYKLDYPWQSPATVAHSWGYHALENQWKSTSTLLRSLINNVSLNGNVMLNIGPRANGDVPYEIESRLLEIGRWLERNGESIHGAGGFDLDKGRHDWCRITCKEEGDRYKLYLHVPNWPLDREVKLTGVKSAPLKVYTLPDTGDDQIEFKHREVVTTLMLPAKQPDPISSVIVLEYTEKPPVENGLIAESMSNGYPFTPANALEANQELSIKRPERYGSVPAHIVARGRTYLRWRVYIEEASRFYVDLSYSSNKQENRDKVTVRVNDQEYSSTLPNTGQTVGEPGGHWHIPCFSSLRLGEVEIAEPGYYEVEILLDPRGEGELRFQWIWLEPN
jgi:alpha-L-fucosidase